MKLDTKDIFIAAHKDFDYIHPYKGTIISKNPLNNEYDVPVLYTTETDLDPFKESLAEQYQTYWLYTNYNDKLGDYVCFNQYRRWLNDIYHDITCCVYRCNVDGQYAGSHKYEDFKLIIDIIANKFPEYLAGLELARKGSYLILHNIYTLPKNLFNEYSHFKFTLLKEFIKEHNWKCFDDIINYYNGEMYQCRVLGYLAERIGTIYFCKLINDGQNVFFSTVGGLG